MSGKKVDSNHSEIVNGLRAVGAAVQSIACVGKGVPDLLVAYQGVWHVAEVKDGNKVKSKQKLTTAEQVWHEQFSPKATVHIWTSVDDALKAIGAV